MKFLSKGIVTKLIEHILVIVAINLGLTMAYIVIYMIGNGSFAFGFKEKL